MSGQTSKEDSDVEPFSFSTDDEMDQTITRSNARGRTTTSRSISGTTSPTETLTRGRDRRMSMASRFADDSSGDEGGDVARGLVASGGGAMFGGRAGLGISTVGNRGVGMDFDPVDELDAQDLELPVADDGMEVRVWTEALRVSNALPLRDTR